MCPCMWYDILQGICIWLLLRSESLDPLHNLREVASLQHALECLQMPPRHPQSPADTSTWFQGIPLLALLLLYELAFEEPLPHARTL